jgi:hypothetical protein
MQWKRIHGGAPSDVRPTRQQILATWEDFLAVLGVACVCLSVCLFPLLATMHTLDFSTERYLRLGLIHGVQLAWPRFCVVHRSHAVSSC